MSCKGYYLISTINLLCQYILLSRIFYYIYCFAECRKNGSISMSCIYCHITFTDPRTWERHMTAKHPAAPSSLAAPGTPPSSCSPPARASGGQQRPYCCLTCGERFIQESSLAKHCDEAHMQTDTTGDTDIG